MSIECYVDRVDWLAVEFVCNGTPMRLGDDAVTLRTAILQLGWMLTCAEIANRCGTSTRRVSRMLEREGATICPFCGRYVMCDDGVLPRHIIQTMVVCRMSGHPADDLERARMIRRDEAKARSYG